MADLSSLLNDLKKTPSSSSSSSSDKYQFTSYYDYSMFTQEELELALRAREGDQEALMEIGRMIVNDPYYPGACEYLLCYEDLEEPEDEELMAEGNALYMDEHYASVVRLLMPLAERGNSEAMYLIGMSYLKSYLEGASSEDESVVSSDDPDEIAISFGKAFEYFLKGACNGRYIAMAEVGNSYEIGRYGISGEPEDLQAARYWYERATFPLGYEDNPQRGNSNAATSLGSLYHNGEIGDEPDYDMAVKCFRRAIEISDDAYSAMYDLGLCYEHGHGVPQDLNQAEAYYKKAADIDNSAYVALALLKWNHPNSVDDMISAIDMLRKAANERYSYQAKEFLEKFGIPLNK